jgi:hypothetical protein
VLAAVTGPPRGMVWISLRSKTAMPPPKMKSTSPAM